MNLGPSVREQMSLLSLKSPMKKEEKETAPWIGTGRREKNQHQKKVQMKMR